MALSTASAIASCCGRLSNCGRRAAMAPCGPRIDSTVIAAIVPRDAAARQGGLKRKAHPAPSGWACFSGSERRLPVPHRPPVALGRGPAVPPVAVLPLQLDRPVAERNLRERVERADEREGRVWVLVRVGDAGVV